MTPAAPRDPATERAPERAVRLLERFVPRRAVARSIVGDLREEQRERFGGGRVGAWLWFWWQLFVVAITYGSRRGRELGPMPGPDRPQGSLTRWSDDLRQDLRLALRTLRSNPVFAGAVVVTLALGVGANAAMFGISSRLLLRPPPHIEEPRELVHVRVEFQDREGRSYAMGTMPYAVIGDLRGSRAFAFVAGISREEVVVGSGADARKLPAAQVTDHYFLTLGTTARVGRLFSHDEAAPPAGAPVVVVSSAFWERELGADPRAIGTDLVVDGVPRTIIGVAPPGFTGDTLGPVDVWIPHASAMATTPGWWTDRYRRQLAVVARLNPEITPEAARDLADAGYRHGQEGLGSDGRARVELEGIVPGLDRGRLTAQSRVALWLNGVAAVVLVVAISNVTGLFLVRAVRRRHEIAVRSVLGMGTPRLLRQLLTESLLLCGLGGIAGLAVAAWGAGAARAVLLPDVAATADVVDPAALAAAAASAVLAALVAGLAPVLHLRGVPVGRLRMRTTGMGETLTRNVLLVLQSALTLVLLFGALLFVASLLRVQSQDFGFALDSLVLANGEFADSVGPMEREELYDRGVGALSSIPGVAEAVPVWTAPFGPRMAVPVAFPGIAQDPFEGGQLPYLNPVAPAYFEAMGMEIVEGRGLRASDGAGAPWVAVVSENMARALWPEGGAIGACLQVTTDMRPVPPAFAAAAAAALPCREVVGVVNDARRQSIRPEDELIVQYYLPRAQLEITGPSGIGGLEPWGWLVRLEPGAASGQIGSALQGLSEELRYVNVRSYAELLDPQLRPWRLGASMFTVFGLLALTLAGVGIYSTLAFAISQRRREMGIRLALGAPAGNVFRMVVAQGLLVAATGSALGALVSWIGAGQLGPLLFETSPRDVMLLAVAASILLSAAAVASLVPAWRATCAEPAVVLRSD